MAYWQVDVPVPVPSPIGRSRVAGRGGTHRRVLHSRVVGFAGLPGISTLAFLGRALGRAGWVKAESTAGAEPDVAATRVAAPAETDDRPYRDEQDRE